MHNYKYQINKVYLAKMHNYTKYKNLTGLIYQTIIVKIIRWHTIKKRSTKLSYNVNRSDEVFLTDRKTDSGMSTVIHEIC